MTKKSFKLRNVVKVLVASLIVFIASCGNNNSKGLMTVNATGTDIVAYETAFKKYFDAQGIDAAKYGYNFVISPSLYVVNIINSNSDVSREPYDKGFLILISDTDKNVIVEFIYSVGAKEENPVIVNPNMLAGKATVTKSLTIVPKNEKGSIERTAEITKAVYDKLVEIERKAQ